MSRAERPRQREFTSDPATIAKAALGALERYWPTETKEIHYTTLKLWRKSVAQWSRERNDAFTVDKWQQMYDCPSSLYWSPNLIRIQGRRPRARFCFETWLCPFCYCREIVKFLRPFETRQFSVRTLAHNFEDPYDAWEYGSLIGRELLEQHNGFACWRQVYPNYDRSGNMRVRWRLCGTWLYPGAASLNQNAEQLIDALAYPMGTLTNEVSFAEIERGREFMKRHQGRMRRGCYAGRNERLAE